MGLQVLLKVLLQEEVFLEVFLEGVLVQVLQILQKQHLVNLKKKERDLLKELQV